MLFVFDVKVTLLVSSFFISNFVVHHFVRSFYSYTVFPVVSAGCGVLPSESASYTPKPINPTHSPLKYASV